jgi:hypothetical protein
VRRVTVQQQIQIKISPDALFYARLAPPMCSNFASSQDAACWKTFAHLHDGMK